MRKLGQFALDFLKQEDGPTAVEYAVMLALIIVVCIAAITRLGLQRPGYVQQGRLRRQHRRELIGTGAPTTARHRSQAAGEPRSRGFRGSFWFGS